MEHSLDYLLGVVGGMGPMATAAFMEIIIRKTDVTRDQEHMPMLVQHLPFIPDRTAYLLSDQKGNTNAAESPLPYIIDAAKKLEKDGATEIAIPCVTAHFFHDEIQKHISIPLLDGVEDTAIYLSGKHIHCAGILATSGTVETGLFSEAFASHGMDCIYPQKEDQDAVMQLIYEDIKAGRPVDRTRLLTVTSHLMAQGAETIVLGCTELSLIPINTFDFTPTDVLEVLADCCIDHFRSRKKR